MDDMENITAYPDAHSKPKLQNFLFFIFSFPLPSAGHFLYVCIYEVFSQKDVPCLKIRRAWCSLPLSLRLVCCYPQCFQTPEWDIHIPSILWQNLGVRIDVPFVDNDGCSHQGDWHGGLNYITFKVFFFFPPSFSRLMLQWDEAHAVGILA